MSPHLRILVGGALEQTRDERVDIGEKGLARDWDEVRQACDGVRAHFRGRVF